MLRVLRFVRDAIRILKVIRTVLEGNEAMDVIVSERDNGTRRVQVKFEGESLVEQSHKKRVNINTIVAKAHKTGLFPQRTDRPTYGNFVGALDYQESCNRILKAKEDFLRLPSDIRKKFDNDPGKLLQWINDPENQQEAIEMGLIPDPGRVAIAEPEEPQATEPKDGEPPEKS